MVRTILTVMLLTISIVAQADLKGVFEIPGQASMTIYYKDNDNIRLETPEQGFILVSGDKVYTVIQQGNQRIAVDMAQMGEMMRGMQPQMDEEDIPEPDIRITDRTETIAGYQGRVHEVTLEGETTEIVLTDDEDVVQLTRGFLTAISRMGQSVSPDTDLDTEAMLRQIGDTGYPGILKQDAGLVLKSLESTSQPDDFYRLPEDVQIMDMQQQGFPGGM